MRKRRTYTEEFKRDAVELSINSDKNCTEIAEDLGINYNNLIRWRKKYRDNGKLAFPGKGKQKLTSKKKLRIWKMNLKKLNLNVIF